MMLNDRQPSIDQRRGSRGDGQHRAHFVVRASACDFYSLRPSPVARPFLSGLQSPVSAFSSPPFLQILSSCLKFTKNPNSFFLLTSAFILQINAPRSPRIVLTLLEIFHVIHAAISPVAPQKAQVIKAAIHCQNNE